MNVCRVVQRILGRDRIDDVRDCRADRPGAGCCVGLIPHRLVAAIEDVIELQDSVGRIGRIAESWTLRDTLEYRGPIVSDAQAATRIAPDRSGLWHRGVK